MQSSEPHSPLAYAGPGIPTRARDEIEESGAAPGAIVNFCRSCAAAVGFRRPILGGNCGFPGGFAGEKRARRRRFSRSGSTDLAARQVHHRGDGEPYPLLERVRFDIQNAAANARRTSSEEGYRTI